jgi:hypothetical protein
LTRFGTTAFWHEADIKLRPLFCRYGLESGHYRLIVSISVFDPYATWPQHYVGTVEPQLCHRCSRQGGAHLSDFLSEVLLS